MKALESDGIIDGYRAEVNRVKAGLGLTVFIELQVEGHSRETSARIEQALTAIPAVVACHVSSGAADFLVEVAVPDLARYEHAARRGAPGRPARLTAQAPARPAFRSSCRNSAHGLLRRYA